MVFKKKNYKDNEDNIIFFNKKIMEDLPSPRKRIELSTLSHDEYQGMNFLVVDDNLDMINIITGFLQQYGASVDSANNGKIALDIFGSNQNKFSMILMDVDMPVLNGKEAAKMIRKIENKGEESTPIIGISGNYDNSRDKFCFDLYLSKPFDLEELAAVIKGFQ